MNTKKQTGKQTHHIKQNNDTHITTKKEKTKSIL